MQCKSILGATLTIRDGLHTLFWGHQISEKLGKALAFPSHGRVTAFTAKVLLSRLQTGFFFFLKTRCKQNAMESVAGPAKSALHTNWRRSRERCWQAAVATGPGQTHRPDCSHSMQLGALG